MHHRVFALLDDVKALDPVLAEIEGDERCHGQCSVIVHKDRLPEDEVGFAEIDERRWLGRGVLFGAVAGGLVGLAMGPLGLVGVGPLAAAAFGAGAGGVYAGIIGALTGASGPHHALEELAAHLEAGGVLLTIDTPSLGAKEDVERIVHAHGGRVAKDLVPSKA